MTRIQKERLKGELLDEELIRKKSIPHTGNYDKC